ncbi:MAG: pyridoxamine 5'-phosphate oxidase family protein [Actinobacteria bacterium]|nr:pyridoxamine 5'-phosphate oxidase family protein [Actinomycetota bacterium]
MQPTERTRVLRNTEQAAYDPETVGSILDAGLVAHVGIVHDGAPVVIPMVYARVAGTLYLHGSVASRLMRTLRSGAPACVTVTVVDGIVLARSAFNMTLNYRSVVVHGSARLVDDEAERDRAFRAVLDHLVPGHYDTVRPPNAAEARQTMVLAISLLEASAKLRSGPPADEPEDLVSGVWAGEIPLHTVAGAAVPDPAVVAGTPLPPSVRNLARFAPLG